LQPIFVIENLHKKHPNEGPISLFDQINTSIYSSERITILGPSGQGKSTLLRTLARLESFDSGCLTLHGRQAASWHPCDWRKKVCYVPQLPAMLPTTVADNLSMVSKLHQLPFDKAFAIDLMEQVGLAELDWNQNAADLSGGQKQRVQLIRSLLLLPELLLLDEVTSALDAQSKQEVESMLVRWSEERGASLIWVTHDWEQARKVSHRFWFLENGSLSEETAEMLLERSSVTFGRIGGDDPCHL
jgi:putative ABC transport system ATP-binding protein